MKGPGPALATLLVALLCLVWGSTWLVIQFGLEDMAPFTAAALRFLVAACCMIVVARLLGGREGGGAPAPGLVVIMGVCNFAVSYGAVYWAEQYLPSALASILFAVFPIFVALLSHFVLTAEKLNRRHAMGFSAGFVGVVLLVFTDVQALGPEARPAALVFLLSPVSSAIGTVLVKKWGAQTSSLRLNRDGMFVGAALLGLVALVTERDRALELTTRGLFSLAYLALVGTVLTFGLYFWLLRFAPAYKLAVIPYVTPAVALLLGWWWADEAVHGSTLLGLVLILCGVLLVTRNPRGRRRADGEVAVTSVR